MTSSPPTTVHVGRWGQQRGTAPAPPLDTATAVSDTLIVARHGRFQFSEGGVSVVARPTASMFGLFPRLPHQSIG